MIFVDDTEKVLPDGSWIDKITHEICVGYHPAIHTDEYFKNKYGTDYKSTDFGPPECLKNINLLYSSESVIFLNQLRLSNNFSKYKKINKMTQDQKVKYIKSALTLAGLIVDEPVSETIIRIYESVMERQDEFSLGDINAIVTEIKSKYNIKVEDKKA